MTEPAKKAAHRPKLPPGEGKTASILLRLRPDTLARADALSQAAGISRNAWIEALIKGAKK